MSTVLVVDDDVAIADYIETNLRHEGFDVVVANGGAQALDAVRKRLPDLALIDVVMPEIDGIEVVRRLRASAATANLPVILLTARADPSDRIAGLAAGADDYMTKPFDTLELVTRIRAMLRRSVDMREVSPLTGLPGNHRIDEELRRRALSGRQFAVCHVDLDNFKAFNDRYGWLHGDDAIVFLAGVLRDVAARTADPAPFVGHIGGDDFVVVSTPEQADGYAAEVVRAFEADRDSLHDPGDVARGAMTVLDRQGHERNYPLMTVSIGIASTALRRFGDYREVASVASEMKEVAKSRSGSAVAVDRRRG